MIDLDDVGNGFLFGGIIIGLILLAGYFYLSKPVIDECEKRGGIVLKSNGKAICVRKDALIQEVKP